MKETEIPVGMGRIVLGMLERLVTDLLLWGGRDEDVERVGDVLSSMQSRRGPVIDRGDGPNMRK